MLRQKPELKESRLRKKGGKKKGSNFLEKLKRLADLRIHLPPISFYIRVRDSGKEISSISLKN